MILTLSFSLLISFFHRFAIGVVAEDLQRDLLLSAAMISNLGAAYFYIYGLCQLPVGFIVDGIGPRRLVLVGMITAAFGSLLFAWAPTYSWALLGRIVVTLGVSGIFLSTMKTQAVWFQPQYFSLLAGLVSAVGNLGSVLAQAPLAMAAVSFGWRGVFNGLAGLSAVAVLLIYLFVHDHPEDRGFPPLYPYRKVDRAALRQGIGVVVKNRHTWTALVAFAGLMGTNVTIGGVWGVSYLSHIHGFTREAGAGLMLWMTLGLLVGSPLHGFVVGRWGRHRPLIVIGSSITLFLYGILWIAPTLSVGLWSVLMFVLGFSSITFILCFTSAKEANPLEYAGLATSVVNFGAFTISSLISLLMGAALDRSWDGTVVGSLPRYSLTDFRAAFLVLIGFQIVGWLAAMVLYEKRMTPRKGQTLTDT